MVFPSIAYFQRVDDLHVVDGCICGSRRPFPRLRAPMFRASAPWNH